MTMDADHFGLGIDAGGTQTRWALARSSGEIVATGFVSALTALQMGTEPGRAHIRQSMTAIADALPLAHRPGSVCAGITGYTESDWELCQLMAAALGIAPAAIALRSDI